MATAFESSLIHCPSAGTCEHLSSCNELEGMRPFLQTAPHISAFPACTLERVLSRAGSNTGLHLRTIRVSTHSQKAPPVSRAPNWPWFLYICPGTQCDLLPVPERTGSQCSGPGS